MIRWWQQRRARRRGRELVKGTRKLLRMHRDILEARHRQDLSAAADALATAVAAQDAAGIQSSTEKLERLLERALPAQKHSAWRENVEVFLVAAIVAMGVRTFFLQPFKIPTGSMQPTLYGIVPAPDCERELSLPARLYSGAVRGVWPQRPQSSMLTSFVDYVTWGIFHQWPRGAACEFAGDHIFVDRFTYHFRKPRRGDVVVFATQFMHERGFDPRGSFYIKRAVGLPGDRVEISPPYLLVNGSVLEDPPIFQRIHSMQDGYQGYKLPDGTSFPNPARWYLNTRHPAYTVPPNGLMTLGDNTSSSLDSRYWGAVPAEAVIGRAIFVYWPFTERFGAIR